MKKMKPLSIAAFNPRTATKGDEVIVPVQSLWTNPLFVTLGVTAFIGVLKIWFAVDLLTVILPGVKLEVAKAISDTALVVFVPILGIFLEANRKTLNTVR